MIKFLNLIGSIPKITFNEFLQKRNKDQKSRRKKRAMIQKVNASDLFLNISFPPTEHIKDINTNITQKEELFSQQK